MILLDCDYARPDAAPVPEGQMRIAQRFNAGCARELGLVPKGRLRRPFSAVPSGLSSSTTIPALKRWAILNHPSGTKLFKCSVLRLRRRQVFCLQAQGIERPPDRKSTRLN